MGFPKVFMDIRLQHQSFHFSFIALLITLLIALSCGGLARWQYHRAIEKQQSLSYLADKASLGELQLTEALLMPYEWNKTGVIVHLKGVIEKHKYWLLDNKVLNGRVGYDVLIIAKVANEPRGLIVNLGWIPASDERSVLPAVSFADTEINIKAQIKDGDLAGFYLAHEEEKSSSWPKRIQYIDIDKLARQSAESLLPFMAYSKDSILNIQPHYEPVVMTPQKHKAYALQWGLIGIAAVVVFVFASKVRGNHE